MISGTSARWLPDSSVSVPTRAPAGRLVGMASIEALRTIVAPSMRSQLTGWAATIGPDSPHGEV